MEDDRNDDCNGIYYLVIWFVSFRNNLSFEQIETRFVFIKIRVFYRALIKEKWTMVYLLAIDKINKTKVTVHNAGKFSL